MERKEAAPNTEKQQLMYVPGEYLMTSCCSGPSVLLAITSKLVVSITTQRPVVMPTATMLSRDGWKAAD